MGNTVICRFARRLALVAALAAAAFVFFASPNAVGALLDSRTVTAFAGALGS
jgi:hypothetical protein